MRVQRFMGPGSPSLRAVARDDIRMTLK